MKVYDLVKEVLIDHADARDSDKKLMWTVWYRLGYIVNPLGQVGRSMIEFQAFTHAKCPAPETIRRCRQKIQETHPELRSSKRIQQEKDKLAAQKGTHVFREEA